MNLNKHGFAVSTMLYGLIFVTIAVFYLVLLIVTSRYQTNENHLQELRDELSVNWAQTKSFYYTGAEQTYTVRRDGVYKLEVWGGQGGTYNSTYIGGYGGYASGLVTLSKFDIVYVYVGGEGRITVYGNEETAEGGFNGGGQGYGSLDIAAASGGGATHIATASGLLSTFSEDPSPILIVAGGGGGSGFKDETYHSVGGSGGGLFAQDGSGVGNSYTIGRGGTQIAGGTGVTSGTFGGGANASSSGTGGGGGFYGGGSGRYYSGAGGGSSYINTSRLTDYGTWCYTGCSGDNTTVVTTADSHVSGYPNKGSGCARITFIREV